MSIATAIPILGDLIKLGSELIEDPDKKNEYAFKLAEKAMEYQATIITTKTSPKVDALVKIMYAVSDIIQKTWRPAVGAAMTAFGMYCHYKGISMDTASQVIFDSAFPAWGVSRHIEKQKEKSRPKDPSRPDSWHPHDEYGNL